MPAPAFSRWLGSEGRRRRRRRRLPQSTADISHPVRRLKAAAAPNGATRRSIVRTARPADAHLARPGTRRIRPAGWLAGWLASDRRMEDAVGPR